jgi:phage host-nuclease inhibitor protein Gam
VPNLCIGFVVYSSRGNLQALSKAIKNRYNTKTEHLGCSIKELEKFVFSYCDLMD